MEKYFHSLATSRRRRNRVLTLRNENGNWVDDQNVLKNMGVEFFEKQYEREDN